MYVMVWKPLSCVVGRLACTGTLSQCAGNDVMGPPSGSVVLCGSVWFCVIECDPVCGSSDMGDRCRKGLVALMVSGTQKEDSRSDSVRCLSG